MKKLLGSLIIFVAVIVAMYLYLVHPVDRSTTDVQDVTDILRPMTDITKLYRISKEGSKAEFQLHELLYGKPKLVVGTTTEIAGDIGITNNHIKMGEIKLDARTLMTDSAERNGAMNRFVLKTSKKGNEYVLFRPLANDWTGNLELGKEVSFKVIGELTISGVMKEVSFDVTMTVTPQTVTGVAKTTIKRSDFGIKVPDLPFIANVEDVVDLVVTITAHKTDK